MGPRSYGSRNMRLSSVGATVWIWIECVQSGYGLGVSVQGSCVQGRSALGVMMLKGGGTFKRWAQWKVIESLKVPPLKELRWFSRDSLFARESCYKKSKLTPPLRQASCSLSL